jgi:hypothetical protein
MKGQCSKSDEKRKSQNSGSILSQVVRKAELRDAGVLLNPASRALHIHIHDGVPLFNAGA